MLAFSGIGSCQSVNAKAGPSPGEFGWITCPATPTYTHRSFSFVRISAYGSFVLCTCRSSLASKQELLINGSVRDAHALASVLRTGDFVADVASRGLARGRSADVCVYCGVKSRTTPFRGTRRRLCQLALPPLCSPGTWLTNKNRDTGAPSR